MRKSGVTETGTGSNDSTAARGGRAAMAEKVKVVNGASSRSCRSVAGKAGTTGTPLRLCEIAETRGEEINGGATEVNSKI